MNNNKEDYTMIILNNNTGELRNMSLSESTNTYTKTLVELKEREVELKVLDSRLRHLLQSETVAKYDEKDYVTGEYKLDIKELDQHFNKQNQIEEIKTINWDTKKTNQETLETFCIFAKKINEVIKKMNESE